MSRKLLRNFVAIVFIIVGIVLVLDNIGLIQSDIGELWHYIYPVFLFVFGAAIFIKFLGNGGIGWVFGSFFMLFGLLLLLGTMNIIQYSFSDIVKLWPLLIIYIGFGIFGSSNKKKKTHIYTHVEEEDYNFKGKQYGHFGRFSVGNYFYDKENWKVEPMHLKNIAGDYFFDFTKAFIPEEEIPIIINSWAGDIQMILPQNLDFKVDATVLAGEIKVVGQVCDGINRDLIYETPDYDTAVKKLNIKVVLKAGSIKAHVI